MPWSSWATPGLIVDTAVASKATKAHRANRPPVVAAYCFDRSPASGLFWAPVVVLISSHPRTSSRLEVNERRARRADVEPFPSGGRRAPNLLWRASQRGRPSQEGSDERHE